MKRKCIWLIIVLLILIACTMYQRECYSGLQIFNKGGIEYNLRNDDEEEIKSKQEIIDLLNKKTSKLIESLRKSPYKSQENVKKLLTNWTGNIEELEPHLKKGILAYNVNKGERINICLTDPITEKVIKEKINTMFFIILHELAHVMTRDYAHNKKFWDNYRFLIKYAEKEGLYEYVNYKKEPDYICGTVIDNTPYMKK